MDAEEWESWISNRVNQITNEMSSCGKNLVVFPAKWNDLQVRVIAGEFHDPVAVEAGAINHASGPDSAESRFEDDAVIMFLDAANFTASQDLAACLLNEFRILSRDRSVVGNTGTRYGHRRNAATIGLNFSQLLGPNHYKSRHFVGYAATHQLCKTSTLGFIGCDDDFAANIVWNGVLAAKLNHSPCTGDAVLCFERTWLVID